MSIAIAHKDYAVRGGGERLVETLADYFDAPLYVGNVPEGRDLDCPTVTPVDVTKKQRWLINRGGTLRAIGYMAAWENETRLAQYETIITSGNEPLWYVPQPEQTVVAYCHSPPRVLYDLNHNTGVGTLGTLLRAGKRALFRPNVDRPDLWVANGEAVARRLSQYWNIPDSEIRIVYPPIETEQLHPQNAPTEDYYLYLGRLAYHKRVELAVDACNELSEPLKVAGRGPQKDELTERAGPTVDVLGYVSEERKHELLAGAKALLMPAENEDFGMVPVEALASGTPVIGVEEGMTQAQIKPRKNGYFASASAQGFASTIQLFESQGIEWSEPQIRTDAIKHFGKQQFYDGMERAIEVAQGRTERHEERRGAVTV